MVCFGVETGSPYACARVIRFASRGSNITHADEIALALDRLIQRTGESRVDVVAHSMSGLALRWFLAHAGDAYSVRRAVFVATPHHGTWLAHAGWGAGAREMRPGSPFLQQLHALELPPALRTFTIRTLLETHVFPHRNAILAGATDHLVRSSVHARMLHSPRVMHIVRACLTEPD
jgi:triacylglycerol lipase